MTLAEAVAARFYAVNGRHEMTAEDDEYVSTWFAPLEEVAAENGVGADDLRELMLTNRLPLSSYIRSDGTQMVPRDLLTLVDEAGGPERLRGWFAAQWESPEQAVREWDEYLSGQYVCLRSVTPANIKRKDELVAAIKSAFASPEPTSDEWLDRLHSLIDELERIEPPFAPSGCASVDPSRATRSSTPRAGASRAHLPSSRMFVAADERRQVQETQRHRARCRKARAEASNLNKELMIGAGSRLTIPRSRDILRANLPR
jgi:hypothetical protein